MKLTTLAQLNGNISAICDISKNNIKHVTNNENSAQNTWKIVLLISWNLDKYQYQTHHQS